MSSKIYSIYILLSSWKPLIYMRSCSSLESDNTCNENYGVHSVSVLLIRLLKG
ncbi:hypothetical protein CDL12_28830 [Handroanthus impetiginosus]|uniref:Uncharacterized protein n=1 Tax=Handroanthus impetiginosus TaxID=429701 RepID=A0A2G9G0L7_9LAMI|nr:hypothetical protein CDL12_28830 [Handroanthus impetiginosus]